MNAKNAEITNYGIVRIFNEVPSVRLTLNTFEIQSYFLLFLTTIMLKDSIKA